ncbi:unnamed protein product (macronuclear) [Paramecium tetraurelia]|uniref:Nucleoporin Nup54 alpha-helical domain-containing protein n=1 Tax=Paramecium tetraurelia TaxID=5888 RepID=A0CPS0_PARTE|nr:uncharacterized protein GSPATT00009179001 [Paramecium tetraurelia]CAK72787.1 unnamed protein product [Paramecium tetraurelia]|eukprot:XP_001440184.1 hypothetical protein (macronuclear) [Paramecium tetraurelia strain d4-2]
MSNRSSDIQQPYALNSKSFSLLRSVGQFANSSDFGNKLFGEHQAFIQKGQHFRIWKNMWKNQENIQLTIRQKMKNTQMNNNNLSNLDYKVQSMKYMNQRKQGSQKISVLNQQQQIIDNLFSQDQTSYQKRLANQNVKLETISLLIERVHALSTEGHSLIEKDNLLEEIKQMGRGKHVEVLAQITPHLDTEQVEKVLNLLGSLNKAVLASLEADEAQEQENIRLSLHITSNWIIILNKKIMNQEVGQKLQDRNDSIQFILDRVREAQQLLNDNLDRIARWSQE